MITLLNFLFAHRVLRFIAAGGAGAAVDFGLLYALTEWLGLWYLASAALAFAAAVGVSFTLQKLWTFRDTTRHRLKFQMTLFASVAVLNLFLNTALVFVFVESAGLHYLLAQFFAAGLIAVSSFFIYRRLIFIYPQSLH